MPPDNELLISKKSLYIVVVPEQTLEPLLFSGEDHPERVHLKSAHTLLLPLPPLDALHYTPSIHPTRVYPYVSWQALRQLLLPIIPCFVCEETQEEQQQRRNATRWVVVDGGRRLIRGTHCRLDCQKDYARVRTSFWLAFLPPSPLYRVYVVCTSQVSKIPL